MNLLDALLSLIAPHECIGCTAEGSLLCESCITRLPAVPDTTLECGGRIVARTTYGSLAKALIWKLKSGSARAAADEIAKLLPLLNKGIIVPLPTASSRARQRGYDQAVLIARAYARRSGLPYRRHLARLGQSRQVGASRKQRQAQLRLAFRATSERALKGAHIVLIDDVSTTGASIESAAKTLLAAGAKKVDAVVFARVP